MHSAVVGGVAAETKHENMSQGSPLPKPATKGRKRRLPPVRLSWPSPLDDKDGRSRNETLESASLLRKRPRSKAGELATMWVDKYSPRSSKDLAVAPKKVKEVQSWLEDASKQLSQNKLLVLVGSPGIGKSTMVRVLSNELELEVRSWSESFVPRVQGSGRPDRVSVEQSSPIDSFAQFLQQCGAGFASLKLSSDADSLPLARSVILLEELPNLHGPVAAAQFRSIMADHLRRSHSPTVLIFSDVSEGKHKPHDLERLIDPNELYSPQTTIIQIHPVTKPKLKNLLSKILKAQNCEAAPSLFEELHLQSGGDIRNAIMTMQVCSTGSRTFQKDMISKQQSVRDVKLSTFHSLGKLLYGKHERGQYGRPVLAFDPDEILERSDLGVGGSLRFLEYHSADFFGEIADLDEAFEFFSDTALLLGYPVQSYRGDTIFPEGCAAAIAGRAVAHTNKNPTPNKFRQFSKPKVFDVLQKRKQNQLLVDQLSRQLSTTHLSMSASVSCSNIFLTELLPSMRIILPDVVNPSFDSFYSIIRESKSSESLNRQRAEVDESLRLQAEILEKDDIANFDSD